MTMPDAEPHKPNSGGYVRLGSYRGVAIHIHWLVPVSGLVVARFTSTSGGVLGVLTVLGLHELGHVWLAKRADVPITALRIAPVLGRFSLQSSASELDVSTVAWGGIAAQAVLLLGALVVRALWASPPLETAHFLWVCTKVNLTILLVSLLPIRGLDGYDAWAIFRRTAEAFMQTTENEKIRRQSAANRARGVRITTTDETVTPEEKPANDEARALAELLWNNAKQHHGVNKPDSLDVANANAFD
jgi:stage IV sporulation protein FB